MMNGVCKNCGREIRIAIFKGGDWCSENCRKELVQKARMKCEYEDRAVGQFQDGIIQVCVIHEAISKYPENRGEHRPCLAVEPYDDEAEFSWG